MEANNKVGPRIALFKPFTCMCIGDRDALCPDQGFVCVQKDDCPDVLKLKSLPRGPEKKKLVQSLKTRVCNRKLKRVCCELLVGAATFPLSCSSDTATYPVDLLPKAGQCGRACNTDARVIKGEDAKLGEFPWAALLGYPQHVRVWDPEKQRTVDCCGDT